MRQGPHQSAQQSTRTGLSPADEMTESKVASVRVTGVEAPVAGTASCVPHRPQTGCWALARVSSTRFLAPQLGQVTTVMGDAPSGSQYLRDYRHVSILRGKRGRHAV